MSIKLLKHRLFFLFVILLFGYFSNSCKKEYPIEKNPLLGDTAIFVGTWNWVYSEHNYNWCDPPAQFELITPGSTGNNFKLIFLENGLISLFKDSKLYTDYRITSIWLKDDEVCDLQNSFHFGLGVNEMEEHYLFGCVNKDTLAVNGFPGFLFQSVPGCEVYSNYFIKQ